MNSKAKPHSASFSSLHTNESFHHFRSVSYFEAVTNASRESYEKAPRLPSSSTPCTPKKIEIEKYSTLPVGNGIAFPSKKTSRSSSLSSFFRKLRPKFHRGASNPWIVIEFAAGDEVTCSDGGSSDDSIEQAVRSKAQHFTSLKDLCSGDVCNCPLRKDTSAHCPSSNCDCPPRKASSGYRSENSLFFRLSPRRRIENLKHALKSLSSKRKRFRTSSSMHSLGSKSCAYKSELCLRTDHKISSGAFASFSQTEHGRASSPVFHFCRPSKQDNLLSLRHSVDCSYLLKIPNSRSSNASLSSVLEDSSLRKRLPPTTLSLCEGGGGRRMASMESIGACSLDLEESAAEFEGDLTASECTLHSCSVQEEHREESLDQLRNGASQCSVAEIKLPSYVGISCAINGYPGYSRFCRSRDNSPARPGLRKASLEPSMLADTTRDTQRYSRSHSDCNGTTHHALFTESKRVTVSKQIQVPLKSSLQYTTEVSLSNGHSSSERSRAGQGELAKEVTKSLVQQRIESLYGREEGRQHAGRRTTTTHDSASESPTPNGKNHVGSVSPPVFRHLNKDFRKQLQINIPKNSDKTRVVKATLQKEPKKENGFSSISNGRDECDRVKSLTPPPVLAQGGGDKGEGYRFLSLIDLEKAKIEGEVRALEEELHSASIPEEALGKMRAACGKANLLVTQKFEQFRGLCWKHIEEKPGVPFYTTASDLAGFWDMVLLQVEDIHATFRDIHAMRDNGWKEVHKPAIMPPVAKIRHSNPNAVSRSNPTTPKRSAKSAELTKAREEARRQLLAAKKKGRQQHTKEEIAIFAPPPSS